MFTSPITNVNSSQIQTNGEMMGSMMDTYCQTESSSKEKQMLSILKDDNIPFAFVSGILRMNKIISGSEIPDDLT